MSTNSTGAADDPTSASAIEQDNANGARYRAVTPSDAATGHQALPTLQRPNFERFDTDIVSAIAAKQTQTEGFEREMPPPEFSPAPEAVPAAAVPPANSAGATPSKQQIGQNASQANGAAGVRFGKPTPISPKFPNFPAGLRSLPNWVLWRYLPPKSDGGKWRKVPFQPNGKPASTTDRSTWSRFEACCGAYARGGFDGVGFVFDGAIGADGLCYCGVDLDSCYDGKNVQSLAQSRIKRLNTYTECSVSGTGYPLHCPCQALERIVKFDGVEIYTNARYFTFTGHSLGEEIKAAPVEIFALVDEVRAKEAAAKQQQQSGLSVTNSQALLRMGLLRLSPRLICKKA